MTNEHHKTMFNWFSSICQNHPDQTKHQYVYQRFISYGAIRQWEISQHYKIKLGHDSTSSESNLLTLQKFWIDSSHGLSGFQGDWINSTHESNRKHTILNWLMIQLWVVPKYVTQMKIPITWPVILKQMPLFWNNFCNSAKVIHL